LVLGQIRNFHSGGARYFLRPNKEFSLERFEILNWKKVNSSKYSILSKLAKDVLAVPLSIVASESAV
jgi:hypothetical protein